MESFFDTHGGAPVRNYLKMRPRDYFEKHVWLGGSLMKRYEAEMRHEIGVGWLMWGADYPHLEGAAPVHREIVRYIFGGMPEDDVRKMLGANAVDLWGFEALPPGGGGPGRPDGGRCGRAAGASTTSRRPSAGAWPDPSRSWRPANAERAGRSPGISRVGRTGKPPTLYGVVREVEHRQGRRGRVLLPVLRIILLENLARELPGVHATNALPLRHRGEPFHDSKACFLCAHFRPITTAEPSKRRWRSPPVSIRVSAIT